MKQPPSRSILLVARGLDPVGTGRQVELAAEGLRGAGYDVHVAITTTGGATPARLAEAGFAVHRVGRRGRVDGSAVATRLSTGDTEVMMVQQQAWSSVSPEV